MKDADLQQTIISQYGNSPRLLQIIQGFSDSIDPGTDIDEFHSMVWDLSTATGFGLDIWGKIVGVNRLLEVPTTDKYLGFDESTDGEPFGQEPLYNGPQTGAYELSDDAFRTLILLKALSNISDSTAASYNRMLATLFAGRGRCYAVESTKMHMQLTFEFYLEPYELAILEQSGALQPPSGVSLQLLQAQLSGTFGFSEATLGQLGDSQSQFILPQTLPAVLGANYDTSALYAYQPFGYGTFSGQVVPLNR